MSLVSSQLDSLPYIDSKPADSQFAAAKTLVHSEISPDWETVPHPSLDPSRFPAPPTGSSTKPTKLDAIDLSRYDSSALSPPTSDPSDPNHLAQWRETIRRAYTMYSYLSARDQQLSLLEAYGKNAWLVGNSQLEDELKSIERSLAETKDRTEEVDRARMEAQESVRGELEGLEQAWRDGVGRLVAVLVARAELDEKAAAAQSGT